MIWLLIYIHIISAILDLRNLHDMNGEIKYMPYSLYLTNVSSTVDLFSRFAVFLYFFSTIKKKNLLSNVSLRQLKLPLHIRDNMLVW